MATKLNRFKYGSALFWVLFLIPVTGEAHSQKQALVEKPPTLTQPTDPLAPPVQSCSQKTSCDFRKHRKNNSN